MTQVTNFKQKTITWGHKKNNAKFELKVPLSITLETLISNINLSAYYREIRQ